MNAELGHAGVALALLASLCGIVALGVHLFRTRGAPPGEQGPSAPARIAKGYALLAVLGAVLATFAIERALVTHDFSLVYVAQNNSRQTPLLYSITGMWSALDGSILLWGLILSLYVGAMAFWLSKRAKADPRTAAWSLIVALVVLAFFFGLMVGPSDPFNVIHGRIPTNGPGPNDLLQNNPLVAFHPPLLYLGLVGFTVPFALALGSLITGRLDGAWMAGARRWTLLAWAALGLGIALGAWWSYQVLGWGGFWAWDPVENAAFLPWLTATAFLHSVVAQERRGLLRVWNLSLVAATFCLTILCTFLTRSGVLESVHAFSDSNLGTVLIAFFAVAVVASVGLIGWRGDQLRSVAGVDSPVSREGAFLANNLAFSAFAFVVLIGTVFPLLVQAVNGQVVTVGRPYFDTMTGPIALAIIFLMAVAPVLPWRKAAPEVLRRRLILPAWIGALTIAALVLAGIRGAEPLATYGLAAFAATTAIRQIYYGARSSRRKGQGAWRGFVGRNGGGMIVHIGVVVIAIGLASSLDFGHRGEVSLYPGQAINFDGHKIVYLGTRDVSYPNRNELEALVAVDGSGPPYHPGLTQFADATQPVGTPAVDSSFFSDVYVTLDRAPSRVGGPALIGLIVQPMVEWLWIGAGILGLGALAAGIDDGSRSATQAGGPDAASRVEEMAPGDGELVAAATGADDLA